jgi:hypothetical protein
MADIDLDIGNYTIKDLEQFFRLNPQKKYTAGDIEQKEYEMREILLKSGHINKRAKKDLIDFLTTAKDYLIFIKCGKSMAQPTSLPKRPQIDNTQYKEPVGTREDNLVQRKDTQYINTFNSEYYAGTMNPLATRTITKCLTIDTRYRENYYTTNSSDFTLQLPFKLNKVVSMQLSAIEIPVTFYGITAAFGNNYLYMEVTYDPSGTEQAPSPESNWITEARIFIIPDGNYNAVDFVEKINTTMGPVDSSGNLIDPTSIFGYVQFLIDINANGSGTGKTILTTTGIQPYPIKILRMDFNIDIDGNVNPGDLSYRIGWNLGFNNFVYEGKTTYYSEMVIEPATVRYIYLAVDDFNNSVNNHFITAFNKSILNPNILARISLQGNYFSILMENDLNIVTEPRKYFGPVDIQRLQIRLYDDRGRILDMNNANYSFCLVFKLLYDM